MGTGIAQTLDRTSLTLVGEYELETVIGPAHTFYRSIGLSRRTQFQCHQVSDVKLVRNCGAESALSQNTASSVHGAHRDVIPEHHHVQGTVNSIAGKSTYGHRGILLLPVRYRIPALGRTVRKARAEIRRGPGLDQAHTNISQGFARFAASETCHAAAYRSGG